MRGTADEWTLCPTGWSQSEATLAWLMALSASIFLVGGLNLAPDLIGSFASCRRMQYSSAYRLGSVPGRQDDMPGLNRMFVSSLRTEMNG